MTLPAERLRWMRTTIDRGLGAVVHSLGQAPAHRSMLGQLFFNFLWGDVLGSRRPALPIGAALVMGCQCFQLTLLLPIAG